MISEPRVRLVQKLLGTHRTETPSKKGKSDREYISVLFDGFGNPIVKLDYRRQGFVSGTTDGNILEVASFDAVKGGLLSLVRYKQNTYIQASLDITEECCMAFELFLRAKHWGSVTRKREGLSLETRAFNCLLKTPENILLVQTPIDISRFKGTSPSRKVKKKVYLNPGQTTPEVNTYVYQELAQTYAHFEQPFFLR